MSKFRTFTCELKDLTSEDFYIQVEVAYENGEIRLITDEFDEEHELNELSQFDQDVIQKRLIFNLLADERCS